jgi:hypothetical protein
MRTAGYTGNSILSSLAIFNPSASVPCYFHATENGSTNPSTGSDGWPIGNGTSDAGAAFFSDRGANLGSVDINTTWLNTASSIVIKVIAVGT